MGSLLGAPKGSESAQDATSRHSRNLQKNLGFLMIFGFSGEPNQNGIAIFHTSMSTSVLKKKNMQIWTALDPNLGPQTGPESAPRGVKIEVEFQHESEADLRPNLGPTWAPTWRVTPPPRPRSIPAWQPPPPHPPLVRLRPIKTSIALHALSAT